MDGGPGTLGYSDQEILNGDVRHLFRNPAELDVILAECDCRGFALWSADLIRADGKTARLDIHTIKYCASYVVYFRGKHAIARDAFKAPRAALALMNGGGGGGGDTAPCPSSSKRTG